MSDEVDSANDIAAHSLECTISLARSAGQSAPYIGKCLECGEPLPEGRRWCDAECRDAWELDQE